VTLEVRGSVEPGFERVAEVLATSDLGRGGGAFAACVDGQAVADVWAGDAQPGTPWSRDTLTTMMSATKGCAALCAQTLCDRGVLDVERPVADYWPEYAHAGKAGTLVRHVLDHTSGMLCFTDPGSLLDWSGRGWGDYDEIARRIAASPPAWEPGTRIGYHAISIGWLLQELVRRTTGDTLGAFFAREVAQPLGLSIFVGTPLQQQPRLAELLNGATEPAEGEGLTSRLRRQAGRTLFPLLMRHVLARPGSPMAQAVVVMHGAALHDEIDFMNRPEVRSLEIPAANGSGDARSLARMYALLAMGGELDGVRLVSSDSVRAFSTKSSGGRSGLHPRRLPAPTMRYALGYEGDFGESAPPWRFGPSPQAFGHLGAGGQIGFADPAHRVSVGFLRNSLADWKVSTRLIDALYACL
jgi:CubicO group peptidase (beta-lactamase class C family)